MQDINDWILQQVLMNRGVVQRAQAIQCEEHHTADQILHVKVEWPILMAPFLVFSKSYIRILYPLFRI